MIWLPMGLAVLAAVGTLLLFWGGVFLVQAVANRLSVVRYNRSLAARITGFRDPSTVGERFSLPQLPPSVMYILRALRHPSPQTLILVGAAVVIGGLIRDIYLATYLLFVGATLAAYMVYRQYMNERRQVADHVKEMLEIFISFYRINQSTFDAFERTLRYVSKGPLKEAMEEAIRTFHTTRDPQRALDRLIQVDDVMLNHLVLLLSAAEGKGSEEMIRLLDSLAERARQRWQVRLKAQGIFASLRITLLVLAGALAAGMAAPAFIPLWRTAFTGGTFGRVLYMVLGLAGLGGGIYFDWRMRRDEEALL